MSEKKKDPKNLLVIDYNYGRNWANIFKNATLKSGEKVVVHQSGWKDIIVQSANGKCVVKLLEKENPILAQQKKDRIFTVDFILIRNFPSDLHGDDFKNVLYAFMFCDIPAVNSLDSIYMCSQKPIVFGKLNSIQKELGGFEKFPLIKQIYYPNIPSSHHDIIQESKFPVVAKIGTVHAGYGKQKLNTKSDFSDFQSCMMITKNYYITEEFLNVDYDLRLQKIGKHYRVYKRSSSEWKQNWGDVKYENVKDYPEHYKLWMDLVQKKLGVDMFALDVLKLKDGKEIILELNDTAMGLMFKNEKEDCIVIKDFVLEKMNSIFSKKK